MNTKYGGQVGFPGGSVVKNPLPVQETQDASVQTLGQEDLLEKEMVPTPLFSCGKSHGQRSLADYCPWGQLSD